VLVAVVVSLAVAAAVAGVRGASFEDVVLVVSFLTMNEIFLV
jgi:hypothetical protein